MNIRVIFLFFMVTTSVPEMIFGQVLYRIRPENADCTNPIELYDTIWGPTTPPQGFGSILEFKSNPTDLYSFEEEHNTVWYLFEAPGYCELTFDIIPLNIKDDYDFLLYKYDGNETCRQIKERNTKPLRSCISRNDTATGSRTGLSLDARDEYIHSGPGASYAKAVTVQKGALYLLVLDNVYPDGDGHHLHLKYRNCKEDDPDPPPPSNYLNINVRDANTLESIEAEITLTKRSGTDPGEGTQQWENKDHLITPLDRQSTYHLIVKAPGYFQFTDQIKTGSDYQTYLKTANLDPIEEGKKISFSNILFVGGSDQFLRESYPVLDNIVQTLLDQPQVEVEIIGHVNDPLNQRSGMSSAHNQNLSERRAQAVYQYLIKKGVKASRLTWSGKSNKEMVYPYANTEDQMQANRRVELYIKKTGP